MGILRKLMPARELGSDEARYPTVANIDEIGTPVSFKYNGKFHTVRSPNNDEYNELAFVWNKLVRVQKDEIKLTRMEILKIYHQFFSVLCDSITFENVSEMTHAQLGAINKVFQDQISGGVSSGTGSTEKKNLNL